MKASAGKPLIERARLVCPQNDSKLCDLILNDAEYRAAWFKASDKINAAQAKIDATKAQNEAEIAAILAKAPKLPNGKAIFGDANGNWFDQDNNPVSESEARAALARQRFESSRR